MSFNVRGTLVLACVLCGWLFASSSAYAQSPEQQRTLRAFAEETSRLRSDAQAAARATAQAAGFPVRVTLDGGRVAELQMIRGGVPRYYVSYNAASLETSGADLVHSGASTGVPLTGAGQHLGVWDAGSVQTTHVEFEGRVVQRDDPQYSSSHATHVAGTMAAAGVVPEAKGFSFEADVDAYDWNDDESEMALAAADGLQVSNHSYGFLTGWTYGTMGDDRWVWYGNPDVAVEEDYAFGFYDETARRWDVIAANAPNYLIVRAAGNERNDDGPAPGEEHWVYDAAADEFVLSTDTRQADGGTDGFDTIGYNGTAKNVLTVGAVEDVPGGYSAPSDVRTSSFSSYGPTDDGRIKPDLVANGVGLYSPIAGGDQSYASFNGTSMASPSVSGAVGLIQEAYARFGGSGPLPAASVKALLIHTADEAGADDGPDYAHGWGLLNVHRAAQMVASDAGTGSQITSTSVADGEVFETTVEVTETEPLRVTIAWTDVAGTPVAPVLDPTTRMLVNDLDLEIEGPSGTITYPWTLDPAQPSAAAVRGVNDRDNVEQVLVSDAAPGTYTVRIRPNGTLDGGSQDVSVVIGDPQNTQIIAGRLTYDGTDVGIGGVTVTLSGDASATTETGGNGQFVFGGLGDGTYTVTPDAASGVSPASETVTLDGSTEPDLSFTAPAPQLAFSPDTLRAEADRATTTTQTLTLTNAGAAGTELQFSFPSFAAETYLREQGAWGVAPPSPSPATRPAKGEVSSVKGPPVTLGAGGPDAFGYRWIDSNSPGGPVFNWTDVQDLGTPVSLNDDDSESVALPFGFPFYGTTQTDVSISSNGYLKFGGFAGSIPYNGIPVQDGVDGVVMPFGADLYPDAQGTIHHYYDEAQGRFIVQWTNIRYFGGGTNRNTFQAILYRDGRVRFQYQNTDPSNYETIGIENLDGTEGLQVAYYTPYVEDELAVAIIPRPDVITGVTPTSGTVASGASTSVTVTFDAGGNDPGAYISGLDVSTNVPGASQNFIPATLTVTAGPPAISASPDTLRFDTVRVGETQQVNLRVRNDGGPLDVTGVTVSDGFSTDVALPFTLAYGEETTIPVTFAPQTEGAFEGNVTVESTDPDDATLAVPLVGTGAPPPDLRLDRYTISSQTLKAGETATEQVTITNAGGTPVEVYVGFQQSASPQPSPTSTAEAPRDSLRQRDEPGAPSPALRGNGTESEATGRWRTALLAELGRDSTETSNGEHEVTVFRGGVVSDSLVFEFEFPDSVSADRENYSGEIEIDVDQNSQTGPSYGGFPGEEVYVRLGTLEYGDFSVDGDSFYRFYNSVLFDENRVRLAFPLEVLGGDERMTLRANLRRGYGRYRQLPNDGVAYVGGTGWMTTSTASFTLAPGESLPVDVTFDPTYGALGSYEGEIVFYTNDPQEPVVELGTSLTVDGAVVDWMTEVAIQDANGTERSVTLGTSPVGTDHHDLAFGESNYSYEPGFNAVLTSMRGAPTYTDVRSDTARHVRVWWIGLQSDANTMPVTMTWDPATLPDAPVRLVDAYGGSVVNVDMHDANSLTLSDERVKMLGIVVGEPLRDGFALRYITSSSRVTYDLGDTGISFQRDGGSGGWLLFVQRTPAMPSQALESISEANVSAYRWIFDVVGGSNLYGKFRFKIRGLPNAGIDDAESVSVYGRALSRARPFGRLNVYVDDRGDLDAANDELVWNGLSEGLYEVVFASDTNPLPVELTSLTGTADDDRVTLAWTTASETNNGGFEVQRQSATGRFETLSFVQGAGTTTKASTYRFTDTGIPFEADSLTYRLQQIDLDGTTTLTDPVTVMRRAPDAVTLHGTFPNPARDRATLRFELPDDRDVSVQVYDLLGRRVLTLVDAPRKAGRSEMILDTRHLGTGTYFVRLVAGDTVRTQRMVVVR